MLRTLTIAAGFAGGAMLTGCAAEVAPLDTIDNGPAMAARQTDTAPQTFEVRLRGDTTTATILPHLVEASHARLVEACERTPGAFVRAYDPLASGAYVDVPCAVILGGTEATVESRRALTSDRGDEVTGSLSSTSRSRACCAAC